MGPRPERPSAAADKAAAAKALEKLQRSSPPRLSIDVSPTCQRAVKAKAAMEGITIREYLLALLAADGVDVGEPTHKRT